MENLVEKLCGKIMWEKLCGRIMWENCVENWIGKQCRKLGGTVQFSGTIGMKIGCKRM